MTEALLQLEDVRIEYPTRHGPVVAVRGVSLSLAPGEALGLVGESGCGKSTLAGAVLAAVPGRGRITGGRVLVDGEDVARMPRAALRQLRGGTVGLVSQDATAALNPAFRVGDQLVETLRSHHPVSRARAAAQALAMLAEVGLPDPARVMQAYPHRLSGGQQQRVVIAMALLPRPRLLLLDEPTTALDVTVEAGIVDLLRRLAASHGTAQGPGMLFITHNLGLVAQLCTRVAVMYAGEVVEQGRVDTVFAAPTHPYTRALLAAIPRPDVARPPRQGAPPAPLLAVDDLDKTYALPRGLSIRANRGLRFGVRCGRTLAIVGESGCGKSTFARTLMGLEAATAGSIRFDGTELAKLPAERRPPKLLRALQMVFQNPDETLNPAYSVGRQIARAVRLLDRGGGAVQPRLDALLAATRLAPALAASRPRQLSGGQKQRVAIARAFAGQPALVVADEPVSALDVSVQAAVTRLLLDMQQEHGTALLVISHDLGFVRAVADEVAVMYLGEVMEGGSANQVFAPPYHPYTEALLAATHAATRKVLLSGDLPSALHPPAGCPFHTRCHRRIGAVCDTDRPPERITADGHRILCHIPLDALARVPSVFKPADEGAVP
jgi:peptide/nickel transport system ATP-binding protein